LIVESNIKTHNFGITDPKISLDFQQNSCPVGLEDRTGAVKIFAFLELGKTV